MLELEGDKGVRFEIMCIMNKNTDICKQGQLEYSSKQRVHLVARFGPEGG